MCLLLNNLFIYSINNSEMLHFLHRYKSAHIASAVSVSPVAVAQEQNRLANRPAQARLFTVGRNKFRQCRPAASLCACVGAPYAARGQGSPGRKMAAALTFRRLLALPRASRGFGVRVSSSGEKITHTGQVTAAAAAPGARD